MKRLLSIVLAVVLVVAVMPVKAVEKSDSRLIGNSTIELDEQLNASNNTSNFKTVNAERTSANVAEIGFSVEELRSMTTEEFVAKTKDSLSTDYISLDERVTHVEGLKAAIDSDNETIKRIAENRIASDKKMEAAIAYGKELEKAATKYNVVDNVILITNEDELRGIAGQDGYFRLANDIKLSAPWEPVDFYGTLEGGGHVISGAAMQYVEYDQVGFFSLIDEGAVVKNLTLDYPYVHANSAAGALCAYNLGTIDNCHVVNGVVVSYLWADYEYEFWNLSGNGMGGLVGTNEGYIMNSSFTGDVDGWSCCGGICGINAGYVFASFATGNVCCETNTWDYDAYGEQYFYNYGYLYQPTFNTMLRMQWAAFMLGEYGATAFGYNGGLVGQNYFAVFDCCVQGAGDGNNYSVGVVAGLDCVGGLVGGDIGLVSHCYSIDKAFPVLNDQEALYYPWEYGDAGYGIYYDYEYFLVHKGIALRHEEGTTEEGHEIYFFGTCGLPCNDGFYHGTELTEEQFYNPSTFKNWNHGDWNQGDVWILNPDAIPVISDITIIPTEYVIHYMIGNSGGLLDGAYDVYKIAKLDEKTGRYIEPMAPLATDTSNGVGISYWTPANPGFGREAYMDMTYTAYFGNVGSNLIGDTNMDKKVNTADAVYLLRAIADENVNTFSYQQMVNSNANFDSSVNTADVVQILRYCAGIINKF